MTTPPIHYIAMVFEMQEKNLRHGFSRAKKLHLQNRVAGVIRLVAKFEHVPEAIRWIIVSMHDFNELSTKDISKYTNISLRTVQRILKSWKDREDVWGPQHADENSPLVQPGLMSETEQILLMQFLEDYPTSYLDEMQSELEAYSGVKYSLSTLTRTLFHMGISHKRLCKSSDKACYSQRVLFRDHAREYILNNKQLIFIDEVSKNQASTTRNYGWGPKNVSVSDPIGGMIGKRKSVVAGYSLELKLFAHHSIEETYNQERFENWFVRTLLPHTNPYPGSNSVIIIDNGRVHSKPKLQKYCDAAGVLILFLPPYSPDWNPIEIVWACMKAFLKRHCLGEQDNLDEWLYASIEHANAIIDHEAVFKSCGYVYDDDGRFHMGAGFRHEEVLMNEFQDD